MLKSLCFSSLLVKLMLVDDEESDSKIGLFSLQELKLVASSNMKATTVSDAFFDLQLNGI